MSSLSKIESRLPAGFRFHPTDDELICHYLAKKRAGDFAIGNVDYPVLIEVDLNKCEPWDLPEMASAGNTKEYYFFSLPDKKYATGQRTNRATASGYWKATGKDRPVVRKGVLVGMRKTLVFYEGRAPRGKKTDWVMHEFRMEPLATAAGELSQLIPAFKEDWVLCRVFFKRRGISSNGATIMIDNNCDDYSISSSSLPPLMDTFINFKNQNNSSNSNQFINNVEGYEQQQQQVSCFSNPPPDHRSQKTSPDFGDLESSFNPVSCEEKVLKAVLSHFSKFDDGDQKSSVLHCSVAEGNSYFTDADVSATMWYQFGSYI